MRREPLRLVTWNLWWRFGDHRARFPAILDVLRAARPDVCLLQEVWADDLESSAGLLARELGMDVALVVSPHPGQWQRRAGEPGIAFGNAVLSRYPISVAGGARLPDDEPDEGRTAAWAVLEAPGGPVPVVTTQFTSWPARSALRCRQVEVLARVAAQVADSVVEAGERGHPVVVGGDLNAEPDSDEVRLLCGHKTAPVVPGRVLVDAWRWADVEPGWTWDRRNPNVSALGTPSARIDHVLLGPPGRDGRGAVLDVRLVGDGPVDGVWPSDHAGVLVELDGGPAPGP